MNPQRTRFFIYVRKSTDDVSRQVRSIDDQIAELRELAKRDGLYVIEVLIEKQTAKLPGRPVFNAMLDRIEKGEAEGILAWHPDRLARNSLDGGKIIYLLDTKKIAELKFSTYQCDSNAQGKLTLAIAFGLSKYYVDNLSENIIRGKRQKVKNGLWPGYAPIGYLNDKKSKGINPDPNRAPLVRKAFELYASGSYTLDQLAETVNDLGLIGVRGEIPHRTVYHHLLQNPIYCGIIRYKSERFEGVHQPIISKGLFDRVQAVLGHKSKQKTPKLKSYLYRGVFHCGECGCFITTETQKGNNYLRCTKRVKKDCSQPYVRELAVSEQIDRYLQAIALPADIADSTVRELEAEQATNSASRQHAMELVKCKVIELDEKLERLMAVYLDKAISADEYKLAKNKLVYEKQELKDQLATLEANRGDWFEPAIRFVKAAKSSVFLADEGTDVQKRDFLKKVGSNLTISNRHLSVVPRGAWQLVVDQGSFGQQQTAPICVGAVCAGETHRDPSKRRGGETDSLSVDSP